MSWIFFLAGEGKSFFIFLRQWQTCSSLNASKGQLSKLSAPCLFSQDPFQLTLNSLFSLEGHVWHTVMRKLSPIAAWCCSPAWIQSEWENCWILETCLWLFMSWESTKNSWILSGRTYSEIFFLIFLNFLFPRLLIRCFSGVNHCIKMSELVTLQSSKWRSN